MCEHEHCAENNLTFTEYISTIIFNTLLWWAFLETQIM